MLVPPVAQVGTSGRQPGDSGVRAAQSSVAGTAAALWPIAPIQTHSPGSHETQIPPSSAATPIPAHSQGINRYELYSLFPGSGGGSYVATTPGTPAAASARAYHATTHKVSESVFSTAVGVGSVGSVGGYTWGAPTPPPGSPYSPAPAMTQLEMLAKNLATLAPHHAQQSLSLQGAVGLNVGTSLHHAHHTQHTLNLAGLHHLHHGESAMTTTSATSITSKFIDERTLTLGGLHQSPFSPQLSLVTAGTPTLTINNFSSPSTPASVVPTSGLLVQEYQSTGPSPIAGCQSSTSGSCSITPPNGAVASNVSTVMVHGTTTGPLDTSFVQSTLTKKRESFIAAQAQTLIKMENKTASQSCICKNTNITSISGKIKNVHSEAGCSRTLPVVSSWNSQDTFAYTNAINQSAATNLVKRESLAPVPCQVSEVSTSLHATTTSVKIEPLPSKSKNGIVVSTATTTGIPVGIAVARQRLQHQETSSTSLRNVSLNHHTAHHTNYHHFQPDNLGSTTAMAMGGATLLHCGASGDDRNSHLAIPSGALAPSISTATLHSGLGSIGSGAPSAWPPTLWQYPTTAMPALEPIGFPQVAGVGLQSGLQLVRDPTTGQLLLIHAAAEQMQHAVVWPNYANHNTTNIGAPSPLLLPGPTPPSLQLLSDINGARLVLTENKRKQHNAVPIVKIEADCATTNPSATIIASTESSKALQTITTMTGTVIPEPPLLTTLHYYPHAPALVQISHAESSQCRTQQRNTYIPKTTSPVSCLTPPPEITHVIEETDRNNTLGVQDASNQTDAPDIDDHFPTEGLIKQEPKFIEYNHSVITTCKSSDAVSSSIEQLRITNSEVSDGFHISSPSHIMNKGGETENTEISNSHTARNEDLNLVDQTIESVVSCKSSHIQSGDSESLSITDEDSTFDRRMPKFASRLIEITEENCDSFHENLEFFGGLRETEEQHRKPCDQEQDLEGNHQQSMYEDISSPKRDDEVNRFERHVVDQHICNSISSTFDESLALPRNELCETLKPPSETLKPFNIDSNHLKEKRRSDNRFEDIVKSLDMPSIDCEEQHQMDLSVKQELEEPKRSIEKELNNSVNILEKTNCCEKKQCIDKFHAGIENVVEKLKKNAAAAAEAAATAAAITTTLQDNVAIEKSTQAEQHVAQIHSTQSDGIPEVIQMNNGLKKRILRLCEIASNSKDSSAECKEPKKKSSHILNEGSVSLNAWHSNSNNNLSDSSNKVTKHTEGSSHSTTFVRNLDDILKPAVNTTDVNRLRSTQKNNVDLSGLELLSNSIAQLEQIKPTEYAFLRENSADELEESNKNNSTNDINENNNNNNNNSNHNNENNNNKLHSSLGLLCELAEQCFMEEIRHGMQKRSTNNGNSEDISYLDISSMNFDNVTCSKEMQEGGRINLKFNEMSDENARKDVEKVHLRAFASLYPDNKRCNNSIKSNFSNYSRQCEEDHDADDDYTDSETESPKNRSFAPIYQHDDQIVGTENGDSHEQMELDDKFQQQNDNLCSGIVTSELNMREKLADIQKKYKEKQIELSKLISKKGNNECLNRSRKKILTSGYLLSVNDHQQDKSSMKSSTEACDDVAPPQSPSLSAGPKCNVNLVKMGELRSHIKLLDNIPSIPLSASPQTSPKSISPSDDINIEDENNRSAEIGRYDVVSPTLTVSLSTSASKKRKVGRPRKFMCTSTSARHLTETIVAKKSRTKSSLINYWLNSKNRQHQFKFNNRGNHNSLTFKTGVANLKGMTKGINKSTKPKVKPVKQTQISNKNVICSIIAEKAKLSQNAKLERQTMKWNPTEIIETVEDIENSEISKESIYSLEETVSDKTDELSRQHHQLSDQQLSQISPHELIENVDEHKTTKCEKLKKKKRKSMSSSPSRHKVNGSDKKESKRRKSSDCRECKECAKIAEANRLENIENIMNRCKLTSAHLSVDEMRVLTAMGGLFYAGRLSAIQAPDIYAITLDGERGNRPHIHSREEILQDTIVEVCPTSTKQLPPGTRLCAYWSQQYRCLYPGTSVEPSEPDSELDEKFVSVEFDDGDSGKIALNDIRLLQPDYPVVEYDPNPLLTLGKRRRQTSTSVEDKRASNDGNPNAKILNSQSVESSSHPSMLNVSNTVDDITTIDKINNKTADEYRERKKMKKRRRDKLKRLQDATLVNEGKRKHRKHKCCEEHRKHKHRKHRKHKRRHSHHTSYSDGSHFSGGDSCSGHISEGDIVDDGTISKSKVSSSNSELQDAGNAVVVSSFSELPQPSGLNLEKQVASVKADKVKKPEKKSKTRERQESVESRSKMAAFLPARQLWGWSGKGYRRPGAKGRAKKQFFKAIQRGSEAIQIGDSAVFLSTGRPDRPYIGRIESMWETTSSNMIVKVKWFYHPEETVGAPVNLKYPGALFESPHMDENDVQTISHKCEVLPLSDYTAKLEKEPHRYLTIYDNNDIYYLAGYYDPTTYLLTLQPGVV